MAVLLVHVHAQLDAQNAAQAARIERETSLAAATAVAGVTAGGDDSSSVSRLVIGPVIWGAILVLKTYPGQV